MYFNNNSVENTRIYSYLAQNCP